MELFANFKVFIYLFLTALLIAFVSFLGAKRKKHIIGLICSKANYKRLVDGKLKIRRRWKTIFFLLGLFFLFIALAGPQWGKEKIEASAQYSQAVIALDVSNSNHCHTLISNKPSKTICPTSFPDASGTSFPLSHKTGIYLSIDNTTPIQPLSVLRP